MLIGSDINIQHHVIEPYVLVDEFSSTEFFIGTSKSFSDPNKANWRIKRIWKLGSVWKFGYPLGSQDFNFVWDDRLSYDYK